MCHDSFIFKEYNTKVVSIRRNQSHEWKEQRILFLFVENSHFTNFIHLLVITWFPPHPEIAQINFAITQKIMLWWLNYFLFSRKQHFHPLWVTDRRLTTWKCNLCFFNELAEYSGYSHGNLQSLLFHREPWNVPPILGNAFAANFTIVCVSRFHLTWFSPSTATETVRVCLHLNVEE